MLKRIFSFCLVLACLVALAAPAALAAEVEDAGSLQVNGVDKPVSAFKTNWTHYFKMRDIAAAMLGTDKPFNVTWDDALQQITILPGEDYVDDTDPEEPAPDFSQAVYAPANIRLNGESYCIEAYSVQDHYYFKLRDVLALLDIGVFWNARLSRIEVDTAWPYLPAGYNYTHRDNVVILMYHDFTTEPPAPEQYGEVTTIQKFEADIRTLLDAGYKPLSLEDLYLDRALDTEQYFVVTCDDGYLSNYTLAYPLLQELQVPMDIFINTDNVHLSHHFSLEQAAEMEASGLVKVYSHYPQHEALPGQDPAHIREELFRSIETLETVLQPKRFYFFAYPNGAYDESCYTLVSEAGFVQQLVQTPNPALPQLSVRVNVSHDADILALVAQAYKN